MKVNDLKDNSLICDKDKIFDCKLHGKKLTLEEMANISEYYKVSCIARQLLNQYESYGICVDKVAIKLAYEVLKLMNEDGYPESVAIQIMLNDLEEKDLEI